MKRIFKICSIIMATFLLFSCNSQIVESGAISISLPSSSAFRAVEDLDSLFFTISITNQTTNKSLTETTEAGEVVTIELAEGFYTLKISVADSNFPDDILYEGEQSDIQIIAGESSSVAMKLKRIVKDTDDEKDKVISFTITFDANGGSGKQKSTTVEKDKTLTLPECTFVPTGKTHFAGWSMDKEKAEIITTAPRITADTTLYAIWEENPKAKKVVFSIQVENSDVVEVKEGTEIKLSCETEDATIYYKSADEEEWKEYDLQSSIIINEDVTISAYATSDVYLDSEISEVTFVVVEEPAKTVTVTFVANDAEGVMKPATIIAGEDYELPECEFEYDGKYHFVGWSLDSSEIEILNVGDKIQLTEDSYLYAIWEENPVAAKVEFIGPDGKVLSNGKVAYGTKVKLTSSPDVTIYYTVSDIYTGGSKDKIEMRQVESTEMVVGKDQDTNPDQNPVEWKKYDSTKPIEVTKNMSITAYATSDYYNDSTPVVINLELNTSKPSAEVIIDKVTKGDLVMEVMGNAEITLTVKSLSGKAINSCSWLINGVPAKNETTSGMITQLDPNTGETTEVMGTISVITINENTIILDLSSNIFSTSTDYHIRTSSDEKNPNNILSCIAEFEDGNVEDISYTFICGA